MLNIDWSQVPEEFNWVAQDRCGSIYAYTQEPFVSEYGDKWWLNVKGKYQRIDFQSANPDWQETKVQRSK